MLLKYCVAVLVLFNSLSSYSQSPVVSDSVLNELCNSIKNSKEPNDSIKIMDAYARHIYPLLENLSEAKQNEIFDFVFFRMQRQCKEFMDILQKTTEQKGDWKEVESKPELKLTRDACREFSTRSDYYYLEASGDSVKVLLGKNSWQESFIDGSYSKLKFYWVSDCEFELEFIESNNTIRKNFSNKGDKYRYQLFDKSKNLYNISVEVVGMKSGFETFKLYF